MFTKKFLSLLLAVSLLSGLSVSVSALSTHSNNLDFVNHLEEIIRTPGCAKSAKHVFKEVEQCAELPETKAFCKEGKQITNSVIKNNKTQDLVSEKLNNRIQRFVEKFKLMLAMDPVLNDAFNKAWKWDDAISVSKDNKKGHASISSSKNNLSHHKFNRNTRVRRHATTSGC